MSLNLCNFCTARYYNPAPPPHSYRIRNRGSERVNNLPTATRPERGRTGKTNHGLRGGAATPCASPPPTLRYKGLRNGANSTAPDSCPRLRLALDRDSAAASQACPVFLLLFFERVKAEALLYILYTLRPRKCPHACWNRLLVHGTGRRTDDRPRPIQTWGSGPGHCLRRRTGQISPSGWEAGDQAPH